jgi:ATP-binding cassette subfamily F protein 3
MDEPTNHLDLFSKEVLLDALKSFDGTVVFVSHDRYFVNGLATRVVEVEGGTLTDFYGDYEYYLEKKEGVQAATPASPSRNGGGETGAAPVEPAPLPVFEKAERLKDREEQKRLRREEEKRQKQLAETERQISRVEADIARLEEEMAAPGFFDDPDRGKEAGDRHALLNGELEQLYLAWEELSG